NSYDQFGLLPRWFATFTYMTTPLRSIAPCLLHRGIQGLGNQTGMPIQKLAQSRTRIARNGPRDAFKRGHGVLDSSGNVWLGPARKICEGFMDFPLCRLQSGFLQGRHRAS